MSLDGYGQPLPVCPRCKHTFHRDGISPLCQDCRPQGGYSVVDTYGYMGRHIDIRLGEGFAILEGAYR